MEISWADKKETFPVIDVRDFTTNFLPRILYQAQQVNLNNGICVVQSFEPKPLYSALKDLGLSTIRKKYQPMSIEPIFTGASLKAPPMKLEPICLSSPPPS